MLLHASSVVMDNRAVLLTGPSGAGKSDLALRLIDGGAKLLSDDQTELFLSSGGQLMARPPASIAGLIEVRYIGLMQLPFCGEAPVALHVVLAPEGAGLERLPQPASVNWLGQTVPELRLPSLAASTPAKIRLWLQHGIAQS
ncbi:MAG: serine/threonine protein kinase [Alphaproteobacteria bacterium]|nr:serine/threonine protein kinase [Alphaproteobacteria bacterium]MBV8548068.1 serine/threonine protein kinase [Alphaproteobacteria bacterium]